MTVTATSQASASATGAAKPGRYHILNFVIARAMRECAPAVDETSLRYALGAVLLELRTGSLTAIATDGRRMHTVTFDVGVRFEDIPAGDVVAILIPAKAARQIGRISTKKTAEVLLSIDDIAKPRKCSLYIPSPKKGKEIPFDAAEGRFPNWQQVIPREPGKNATIRGTAWQLRCMFAPTIGMQFSIGNDGFKNEASSDKATQLRRIQAMKDAPAIEGEVRCNINESLVTDWLDLLDEKQKVEILFNDGGEAVTLRTECRTSRAVIMPLSLDGR